MYSRKFGASLDHDNDEARFSEKFSVNLAKLLAQLSYALDLTRGDTNGHSIRACYIAMQVGQEIDLSDQELSNLYYTLLLKDIGCSSTSMRIYELYQTDDIEFRRDLNAVEDSFSGTLNFIIAKTGMNGDFIKRFSALSKVFPNFKSITREIANSRSMRGAAFARALNLPEEVAQAIAARDEHWNGGGLPSGLQGDQIPLGARIANMAQVVVSFYGRCDRKIAIQEAMNRSGRWFDPRLVSAFIRVSKSVEFWKDLNAPDLDRKIHLLAPKTYCDFPNAERLDETALDNIAYRFGEVVDSKSDYLNGHSDRVANYADLMGEYLGLGAQTRRWLRRAAWLHDLGKLGISNSLLDKPGELDAEERALMSKHEDHTRSILERTPIYSEQGRIASYNGANGAISVNVERSGAVANPGGDPHTCLEARIINMAESFDALTTDRPWRGAMKVEKALGVIEEDIGGDGVEDLVMGFDRQCIAALQAVIGPLETFHQRFATIHGAAPAKLHKGGRHKKSSA